MGNRGAGVRTCMRHHRVFFVYYLVRRRVRSLRAECCLWPVPWHTKKPFSKIVIRRKMKERVRYLMQQPGDEVTSAAAVVENFFTFKNDDHNSTTVSEIYRG